MIKVSVIVAVYNAEMYIKKCLDSLMNQTLEEIEIIVVNDGSTDGSQEILKEYMEKYSKIKCYEIENGGVGNARNYGFGYAQGEYIGYLDADDFVDYNMFEEMYKKAKEINSDIVECNLRHTYINSEDIEIMEHYYKCDELLMFGRYVVWNKIYRTKWLLETEVRFPEKLIYEDVEFFAKLIPYIKKYNYIDLAPIHYVQRKNSINNSFSVKTTCIFRIMENILEYYQKKGFSGEYHKALEYFFARILLCSSFGRLCQIDNKVQRKMALVENWKLLVNTFPEWKKNQVLKQQKTYRATYMKSINYFTYRIYSHILHNTFILREKLYKYRSDNRY